MMDHTNVQNYHQMSNMSFNTPDTRQQLSEQRDTGNVHIINTFSQSPENIAGFTTQASHMINFGQTVNSNGSVWSNETSRSLGILGGTSIRRVPELENNKHAEKIHHADLSILQSSDLALGGMHTAGVELKGQIDDDWPTKTGTKDYTEKNLPRELMSKMFGLLKEGMFCDAVLQAGNKEIKIHRLVLLAASPFLLTKLPKPSTAQVLRLQIPENIPIEVTSQLVHYLYDGNVSLTIDNVGQFARVASLFKLEHLLHICEDFVECFSLDESLLNVSEEDIIVLQPTPEPKSPSVKSSMQLPSSVKENHKASIKLKDKQKRKSDETVTQRKGGQSKVRIEVSPLKANKIKEKITPPKVLHLYGTRAASAAAAATTLDDKLDGVDKSKGDNSTVSKMKIQSDKLERDEFLRNGEKEINNSITTDRNIDLNPRKRRLTQALLQKEAEIEGKHTDDIDEEIEEYDDDYDTDYNGTLEKNLAQNDTLKTCKRKPVKTLKKMKSVLYQSYKKVRQKKFQITPPPTKPEITMRPPPKKRAKEFAKSEELSTSMNTDSSYMDTSESATSDSSPTKKVQPKKTRTKKTYSVKPIIIENIQHLVLELDKRSAHIAENERQFRCDLCFNDFVFPKRSITHVIKTHEVYPEDVFKHITIHKRDKSPKVCDICGYQTKDPNYYYIHYHKYFRHGIPLPKGWKPFTCEICGKECFTKFQLKDHKLIHTEGIPFVCEVCGQGFKSRTCLNSHMFHRHSTVRKHVCSECQKTFKTKTQLLVHIRTHTGEKPFHCPECTYHSTTRGNMRLHLANRHKLDQQQVKNLMYQIKTLSKAFSMPTTDGPENMFITLDVENEEVAEHVKVPAISSDTSRQQEEDEDAALIATLNNVMATSQESHQVVYREPTLAERHILLQSLGAQQTLADNTLNQDQGQSQVICTEQQATPQNEQETHVLLPEHLHSQPIILQHDQGNNNDGTIIWEQARTALVNVSHGGIALIQDARELQPQESQPIHILNARSLIQEQHPEVTRTLQQEQEHMLASDGNRVHNTSQGQNQAFATDRQILDQAQSLIQRHVDYQQETHPNLVNNQKPGSQIHTQQNQLHINRNQLIEIPIEVIGRQASLNIQSQLANERHTGVQNQEHSHSVVGETPSLHAQEQAQSLKEQAGLFEGVPQTAAKPSFSQTTVPLPRKQQLASLSLGGPITLSYHTNVPVTSKGPTTQAYIVNAQNIITSIESARPSHQTTTSPSQPHAETAAATQQTYDPATTMSSQTYPDANLIYQYYQQYPQGN